MIRGTSIKSPGSTWVIQIDSNPWPCMVLHSDNLPSHFAQTPHSTRAIPILIMGRYILRWCDGLELKEYIPSRDYVGPAGKQTTSAVDTASRRVAFDEALEFHQLAYFEAIITNKRLGRGQSALSAAKVKKEFYGNKPRNYREDSDDFIAGLRPSDIHGQDGASGKSKAWIEYSGMRDVKNNEKHDPTMKVKVKEEPETVNNGTLKQEIRQRKPVRPDVKDEVDNKNSKRKRTTITEGIINRPKPQDPSLTHTAKKPRFGHTGSNGAVELEPDDVSLSPVSIRLTSSRLPAKKDTESQNLLASQQKVRFYLEDNVFFLGTMAMAHKYPHFKSHLVFENGEPCVRSTDLSYMTKDEFAPVAEFLESADYAPRLVKGAYAHLVGVKSISQHELAAIKAGELWSRAKDLGMIDLLELIRRKIHVQWPLDANVLLFFTSYVFFSPDAGLEIEARMKRTLMAEIADRYHELVKSEPLVLSRLMLGHAQITRAVGKALYENPVGAGRVGLVDDGEDDDESESDEDGDD